MKDLLNKYDNSVITGKTTISHKIRVKLSISCIEYCMLELIEKSQVRKDNMNEDFFWRRLGIKKDELYKLLSALKTKELISKDKFGSPIVTDKWLSCFAISTEEFEKFWTMDGKPCWEGSAKKDAMMKYKKTRELYSAEYLLKKRNEYFRFLARPENEYRQKLGCSVFLNLDKERFNTDWSPVPKLNNSVLPIELKEKINHTKMFS